MTPVFSSHRAIGSLVAALTALVLAGCGTTVPQGKLVAPTIDTYRARASSDGLTVGCEALTEETRLQQLFARDLVARGVLPVMLTVQNDTGGSVIIREQDVVLTTARAAGEAIRHREQLAHNEVAPSKVAVGVLFLGVMGGFIAQTSHEHQEYDRQNWMSEVALRSTTLAPGRATTGVVYFPIDSSWLATAPAVVVLVAERPGAAKPIVVAVPLDGKVVDAVMRGIKR